ncbi:MAG: histidinol phosphate phosphatase [Pelosinus sp.]|nr:histidinol phosphate phosphatase [Pelosinus sp.]
MIFDTHMHTEFSSDSKMTIEQAILQAKALNVGIIITEHMDYQYPKPDMFVFDADDYLSRYARYRSSEVLLGIEIGMQSACLDENRRLVLNHSFDYVIGSIHVVDGIDIYYEDFYRGRSKYEVYESYFAAMAECLAAHDFVHSLGHIDYIARYARVEEPEISYLQFAASIDKVLKVAVERELAVEINTKREYSKAALASIIPIYQRFAELGGRLVTLGSDAHTASGIGNQFKQALTIADKCGLRPVYFKEGNPEYIKI